MFNFMKEMIEMEKEEFEALISAYTDKIVDEDCKLVKYVVSMSIKKEILNREGKVIAHDNSKCIGQRKKPGRKKGDPYAKMGAPKKMAVTPKGTFDSVEAAALAYGVSRQTMYSRIRYAKESGNNDFYTILQKDANGPTI